MSAYPNINKQLKIKTINQQEMTLDDDSKWEFMGAERPSFTWQAGDVVVVRRPTGNSPIKTKYGVTNKTRKDREISAVYMGGAISEEEIVEINKKFEYSKKYPSERLDKVWGIKKLLEDASMLLEDWSVWQLTNLTNGEDTGEWAVGQNVRITKSSSGIGYRIENLDIKRPPFIASFLGFQQ